jgi:hypothetical protein
VEALRLSVASEAYLGAVRSYPIALEATIESMEAHPARGELVID